MCLEEYFLDSKTPGLNIRHKRKRDVVLYIGIFYYVCGSFINVDYLQLHYT